MKRIILSTLLLLFSSSMFATDWAIEEKKYNDTYFIYYLVDAPEEYQYMKNTTIFAWQNNHSYRNLFSVSLKDEIIDYLENGDFDINDVDNGDKIFLHKEILDINYDVNKNELNAVWKILSRKYAGFSDMKNKGLTKEEFFEIKNTDGLKSFLDKYIEDCHFNLTLGDFIYCQNTAHDEGTFKSNDPNPFYFEKETSNAYYVRFTNCTCEEYHKNFEKIYLKALDKDFIILDARSNNGGSNFPQAKLRNTLSEKKYQGTVYVLQDNWCFSSGEVWEEFGIKNLPYTCKLVGTHSGGMQNYGNCRTITDKKNRLSIYLGKTSFRNSLPENYLGEGKGYEPDIWATTETMASVLENLGVDLTGITFQ